MIHNEGIPDSAWQFGSQRSPRFLLLVTRVSRSLLSKHRPGPYESDQTLIKQSSLIKAKKGEGEKMTHLFYDLHGKHMNPNTSPRMVVCIKLCSQLHRRSRINRIPRQSDWKEPQIKHPLTTRAHEIVAWHIPIVTHLRPYHTLQHAAFSVVATRVW
jgi:hypothetical protein